MCYPMIYVSSFKKQIQMMAVLGYDCAVYAVVILCGSVIWYCNKCANDKLSKDNKIEEKL